MRASELWADVGGPTAVARVSAFLDGGAESVASTSLTSGTSPAVDLSASTPTAEGIVDAAAVVGSAPPVTDPTGAVSAATAGLPGDADPAATFAGTLVEATNAERSAVGLPPLAVSSCATEQAVARAGVLVAEGRFEHDPLDPVLAACGGAGAGENIALGYATPAEMMAGWMASEGHRANILRAYVSVGIGCASGPRGMLCAQVFLS